MSLASCPSLLYHKNIGEENLKAGMDSKRLAKKSRSGAGRAARSDAGCGRRVAHTTQNFHFLVIYLFIPAFIYDEEVKTKHYGY